MVEYSFNQDFVAIVFYKFLINLFEIGSSTLFDEWSLQKLKDGGSFFLPFLKHFVDDFSEFFAIELGDRREVSLEDFDGQSIKGVGFEGAFLVAHFIKNAAKSPDISELSRFYDL